MSDKPIACETCKHFAIYSAKSEGGTCRYNPPVVIQLSEIQYIGNMVQMVPLAQTVFPDMHKTDWCSKHEER